MRRIVSQVDSSSEVYRTNREHNLGLAKQLQDALYVAREQRPQRALDRLAERGKLTVRARLRLLLDPGTPFLELSPLAASQAYDGDAPQALVVTGIGVVNGREVMVIVPLVFLHKVTGFMVGKQYERRGITKDGAKMLMVQANVTVPKISLLVHASQGAGNYAMAGRAWGSRFLFAWPNSTRSAWPCRPR